MKKTIKKNNKKLIIIRQKTINIRNMFSLEKKKKVKDLMKKENAFLKKENELLRNKLFTKEKKLEENKRLFTKKPMPPPR